MKWRGLLDNIHTILIDNPAQSVYTYTGTYHTVLYVITVSQPVIIHDMLFTQRREFTLKDNTHCTYICYQQYDTPTSPMNIIHAQQDSYLQYWHVSTCTAPITQSTTMHLHKPGAQIYFHVLCIVRQAGAMEICTTQQHQAPDTISTVQVRKILTDTASATYRGLIHISTTAQRSIASQQDKTLLVDCGTKTESIPSLEVLTDDVQCTHGSAVGSFDHEQQWYLQVRGIKPSNVDMLLRTAFFAEILDKFEHVPLRTNIASFLDMVA
jgi:Fe-S cluster assembly scaffold protein SufB